MGEKRWLWQPQAGPQAAAYAAVPPSIEMFYGGARGGGKTDLAIGRWLAHEAEHGGRAHGIVFRTEFTQHRVFRRRAEEVFPPGVRYNSTEATFRFPSGATLVLAHARTVETTSKYQGWSVNFMVMEELGEWPSPEPMERLFGILRDPVVPPVWIATGNPGGAGHVWVKAEFVTGRAPYTIWTVRDAQGRVIENATGQPKRRIYIPSRVYDNPILLKGDPGYLVNIRRQAPHIARAWEFGDWDIAPGAYLEGIWDPAKHICKPFESEGPPPSWKRFVALDWGFLRPYSVGFYARNPDGVLVRYRESYGYGGKPNVGAQMAASELARLIVEMQAAEGAEAQRVYNVADASIWNRLGLDGGVSLATVFDNHGVRFSPGPRGPGSRVSTLGVLVSALREGRFQVTENCTHWLRTVPVLPADPTHPEDVDTNAEDHCLDETRYAVWHWMNQMRPARPESPIVLSSGPRIARLGEVAPGDDDEPLPSEQEIVRRMLGRSH